MKRFKLTTSLLTILCFSLVFTSCSEDNEGFNKNELKGLTVLNQQYLPISDELNFKDDAGNVTVSKFIDGEFTYKKSISNNFVFTIQNDNYKDASNLRIENGATGEYIDIINLVEFEGYRTFDVTNNLGQIVSGFTMEITEGEQYSKLNPWVYVVAGALGILVDLFTDSPLAECTNAMEALNCLGGSNPFMNFTEGGWFTNTQCSVGCN